MVEHQCCNTANIVRYVFESQYACSFWKKQQHDRAGSWEMLYGDAYHRKSFAVGVVQGSGSAKATYSTGLGVLRCVADELIHFLQ